MELWTTYLVYLAISIGLTVWVGRTLHSRGRVFIVDAAEGNETLADSINGLFSRNCVNWGFPALEVAPGLYERVLDDIVREVSVRHGAGGEIEQPVEVALVQIGERILGAIQRPAGQLFIGYLGLCGHLCHPYLWYLPLC